MPLAKLHITKAERNEQYYGINSQIRAQQGQIFNDWAIIILFYSALHYADAVLAQDTSLSPNQQQPINHAQRIKAVSKSLQLAPIATLYLNLYQRSIDARYNKIHFPDRLVKRLEQYDFKIIRQRSRTILQLTP